MPKAATLVPTIPKNFLESLPNFYISNIVGENFKIEGGINIPLDDYTEICGDNGVGKSTILDMVAFCLTGKDSNGNKIEFINKGKNLTRVSLSLKNDCGQSWELSRTLERKEKITKNEDGSKTKTYSMSSSITLNLEKIKDKEFKEIFDEDTVLSILNPIYFCGLSASRGRGLLARIMSVDVTDVFKKNRFRLAKTTKDRARLDALLGSVTKIEDVLKIESELKDSTKKLEKIVDEGLYEIDVLKGMIKENDEKLSIALEELEELKLDADTLNSMQLLLKTNFNSDVRRSELVVKSEEVKAQRIELESQLINLQLAHNFYKKYLIDIAEMTNKILGDVNVKLIDQKIEENKITGELEVVDKEVFEVYYKGLSINNCSMAEKIRACIKIADALVSQSQICLPTFIDNAESITSFENPEFLNQLISLTVVKDAALSLIIGNKMVDLKTKKSLPKPDFSKLEKRVLAEFF